jgi:serine/threonine protein kinase
LQGSDNLCHRCGLQIGWNGSGTLASWLFRPPECQCDWQAAETRPASFQAAETKPQIATASRAASSPVPTKTPTGENSLRYQSKQIKRCQKCNNEYSIDFADDVCSFDGCALVVADADKIVGSTIGARYKVKGLLGAGSWGAVYLAEDQQLKRQVAIKIMHEFLSHDDLQCKRFQREGQTASNLTHPNIATVYDCGSLADGRPFIVMEYLNGIPLDQIVKREGELSIKRTTTIVSQLCDGLHYAHSKGIIHRDLKPGNIVLLDNDLPKLLDFGLAKWGEAGDSLTASGQVVGTAEYMSPEQFQGKELDGRSDIYGLGAVIHYMLTGQKLFQGDNLFELFNQHMNELPKSISAARPDLYFPAALQDTIFRCLSKEPSERFADCLMLKDALSAADIRRSSGVTKLAAATTTPAAAGLPRGKTHRTAMLVIGASLLTVAGVTAIIANGSLREGFSKSSSKTLLKEASIPVAGKKNDQSNAQPGNSASAATGAPQTGRLVSASADRAEQKKTSSIAPTAIESTTKSKNGVSRKTKSIPAETTAPTKSTASKTTIATAVPTVKSPKSQLAEPRKVAELIPKPKQKEVPTRPGEEDKELSLPPPNKGGERATPAKDEKTAAATSASSGAASGTTNGAHADLLKGRHYLQTKNLFDAEKCFRQVLEANDRNLYPAALHELLTLCMQEHRNLEAMNYALEYSRYTKPGTMVAATTHKDIGDCASALRNYVVADRELSLARDAYRDLNQLPGWCNLTRRLAVVKRAQGDYAAAAALYREEADYRQKLGDTKLTERALADIATCQSELKKHPTGTP